MNSTLLIKWLWRFGIEINAMWRRLIAAKYGEDGLGWSSGMLVGPVGCGAWNDIMLVMEDFFRLVKFKVKKGNRVCFGMDAWCTREPLNILFPYCFELATSKHGSVQDHLICSRVFCLWDLKPRRILNDWEIGEMGQLRRST